LISDGTIPIPHLLKHSLPERWFRIHSLPESKRYADDEAEWATLLHRQNTLACKLFPPDATVYFVACEFIPDEYQIGDFDSLDYIYLDRLVRIDMHAYSPEDYLPDTICRIYFAQTLWESGKYDLILRDLAEDKLMGFWVSFETGVIFAPYDGGVDVIMPTTHARAAMRAYFKDWLSPRADGL
jgi:hypothetical protein